MADKLLSIPQLGEALGGMSRSTVFRHINELPNFPKPVKIGGATRFRESDVQAFIRGAPEGLDPSAVERARSRNRHSPAVSSIA